MNNSALVRVHRFKTAAFTRLKHLSRYALRKAFQRFLALLAVIPYIDRYLVISAAVVCGKTRKILYGVKCFAPMAYNGAESLAVKLY